MTFTHAVIEGESGCTCGRSFDSEFWGAVSAELAIAHAQDPDAPTYRLLQLVTTRRDDAI